MRERFDGGGYPNPTEFFNHFFAERPDGSPPTEAAEAPSEQDFLSSLEHAEAELDANSSSQNNSFRVLRVDLPDSEYMRGLKEAIRRGETNIHRAPPLFPDLNTNQDHNMGGSDWGGIRFGGNGRGVRLEGTIGELAALGILLAHVVGAGNGGEETRRREAAEREAARAQEEARERQREAEEATKRANEAHQAEILEREAREEAERRAAEAAVAEEQERLRREEAEERANHEKLLREM